MNKKKLKAIALVDIEGSLIKGDTYEYKESDCNMIIVKDLEGNYRYFHRSLFKSLE